jgi:hypothetical protein
MPLTISISAAQLLKKETFDVHTKTEKRLGLKLQSITKFDDYATILKMFFGFFNPTKKIISRHITTFEPGQTYSTIVSGILVVPVQPERENYIVAFHPEALQKVNWGGDPNGAVQFEPDGKKSHPRN